MVRYDIDYTIIPRALPWARSFWAFSPYLNHMRNLNKEDKIEVIALLSMSIANAEEIKTPADRTKEMVERCCGSWVGEQSAEDIIANINESKMSKSEPVKFG